MLLEDLNEDCLEEIFKYLSPNDLINLYKLNKIFLQIPSPTKVFEDLCEDLSIINKKILAKNSVQLHDFGNNICKTALFRFIDNSQCRSNMADILDKLGLTNVPNRRIKDVGILTEMLELKDSATSWCSLQLTYKQDLDFYWSKRISAYGDNIHDYIMDYVRIVPVCHHFGKWYGDLTQRYFQNIFKNWFFAENVPNSILKTFKSKCNLLPTNVAPDPHDEHYYEKLLHLIQRILEDLKKVLRDNEINEKCLRFTESPEEYLDSISFKIRNGPTQSLVYQLYLENFYNDVIDELTEKMNRYLYKKDPFVHVLENYIPLIITKVVEGHYKSDVEYFGILWRLGNRSAQFLLLARDDLVLFTLD